MRDLIFVSMENWDDIWRRNQFVCAGLARRHPGQRILFVGLERDYSHALRTRDFRGLARSARQPIPDLPDLTVTRPPKWFPNTLTLGRRLNELVFRRHVRRAARALGLHRPILWLNPHSALHLTGKMDESAVIYDITDDWTTLTQEPWLAAQTRAQDRALCRRADAVIVCSDRLRQLKEPLTPSLHLIPNGVDAAHYQRTDDDGQPPAPETAGWRRPVLGYTGTIHPDRVDLSLIERLAARLPSATLALVGPVMIGDEARRRLEARGNVVFTGPKPYAVIPDYMRAFDVCITPHLVSAFTESLNPIKLWEYLAAGKPIISTAVAGFRDYPAMVYLANDAEGFAQGLALALVESPALKTQRRQEAARHSWDSRLAQVETVIAGCLASKADGLTPA